MQRTLCHAAGLLVNYQVLDAFVEMVSFKVATLQCYFYLPLERNADVYLCV
jgi:hypothetical protein